MPTLAQLTLKGVAVGEEPLTGVRRTPSQHRGHGIVVESVHEVAKMLVEAGGAPLRQGCGRSAHMPRFDVLAKTSAQGAKIAIHRPMVSHHEP